jgi:hypothetical protein
VKTPCSSGCPNADSKELCPQGENTPADLPPAKVDCEADPCYAGCPDHGNAKRCPDLTNTDKQTTPSLTVTDVTNIVNRHNKARRMHQLSAIEWDISLSLGAQAHANDCQFKHSKDDHRANEYSKISGKILTNAKTARVGESIIADADDDDDEDVNVDGFFAHTAQWNCEKDKCEPKDGAKPSCGSLRQVLAVDTTKVGCGYKVCQINSPFGDESPKWNFLVCWYNPSLAPNTRPFPATQCKAKEEE